MLEVQRRPTSICSIHFRIAGIHNIIMELQFCGLFNLSCIENNSKLQPWISSFQRSLVLSLSFQSHSISKPTNTPVYEMSMSNQRDMQCANQSLLGEDVDQTSSLSKKLSMIAGARRHLEAGHEKYILDIIQSHPALVILSPILSFFYLGVGPFCKHFL